jgi:hypothetical protein
MEVLVAGSLLGLGYLVNKDNERPLDEPQPMPKTNKKYRKNVYESNFFPNALEIEAKKTNKNFKKAKNAIDTNIIPPYFNDRIINNRTTKIQYLQTDFQENTNSYLDRPQADRMSTESNRDNSNSLEGFYQPINPDNSQLDNTNKMYYSTLTGTYMSQKEFSHQNMVPFFKGDSITQNTDANANNGVLGAYQGLNNYTKPKEAIAPMFKPTKNVTFVNGTPNTSGQILDRYVPSIYRQNEVPIEAIHVGPGLNKGYSADPVGGFQQLDIQEFAMPKTTDEIRTLNDPKISYDGRVTGPAKSVVTNRGLQADVEKYLPDRYYKQTPDMYLKTTGAYTKPEMAGKYEAKETSRQESLAYEGIAGPAAAHVESLRPAIKESQNVNFTTDGPRNANMNYLGNSKNDYSVHSYTTKPNERETTEDKTIITNLTTTVKSIIAPLLDVFRTTRKEDVIGNPNKVGYFSGPNKPVVYDPNDVAKTTIKETNIHNNHTGHMSLGTRVHKGPAYDSNDIAKATIKETNIHNNRTGNMASGVQKGPAYDANDVARTTIKETNIHNNRTGNMATGVQKGPAYDSNDVAKTTIKETNIHNTRTGNLYVPVKKSAAWDPNNIAKTTLKETNIHNNRTGNMAAARGKKGPAYDPNDIAKTTVKETNIHNDRAGNMGSHLQQGDGYKVESFEDKNTNRQFTSDNDYTGIADGQTGRGGGNGYKVESFEDKNTNRQFTSDYEYVGAAESYLDKPTDIKMYDEARLNETREGVSEGRYPTLSNSKLANGVDTINMEVKKLEEDRENQYAPIGDRLYTQIPTLNTCTVTTDKASLNDESLKERIDPNILTAFKNNPYTQPLNSFY